MTVLLLEVAMLNSRERVSSKGDERVIFYYLPPFNLVGNETAKGKLHLSQSAANTSFPEETIAVKRHSEQETIMKARVMTEHYANCLERVAVINETGIDRAKSAQAETLKLFQTEGVIVSQTKKQ